mgnify:CR=1 FL=1
MGTVVSRACNSSSQAKNPCKKIQGLPLSISGYLLGKKGQSFASESEVTTANIRTDIIAKKLQVGYAINGDLEQAIEDGIAQATSGDYRSAVTQHRATIKHKLNAYQQAVLSSWEGVYDTVYFYDDKNLLSCEVQADGSVKGIPLKSILTAVHPLPSGESMSSLMLQLKDNQRSELRPDVDFGDLEGIWNVNFEIISASATELKFKAKACCGDLDDLATADVIFPKLDGTAQAITTVFANGVYTSTGTGLESGILQTSGVLDKTEYLLEGSETVTIS